MTITTPALPPSVLTAIQPAVDAIVAEVQAAVTAAERERLRLKGLAAVRANGHEYRDGVDAILADAVGTTIDGGATGTCQCQHCDDRPRCAGLCEQCEDTSCAQCHPDGECDCDDCVEARPHPSGCRCDSCDTDSHPDGCRCEDCY